jgi:hypothetical protein
MIDKSIRQWYASGLLVKKGPPGTRPGFRYGPHGPSGPSAPSGGHHGGPSGPPGRGDHHAPSPSPRPAPAPSPTPSPHRDPVVTKVPEFIADSPKPSPTPNGDAPGRETYISTQYTPTAPVVFDDYNYPGIDTGPKRDMHDFEIKKRGTTTITGGNPFLEGPYEKKIVYQPTDLPKRDYDPRTDPNALLDRGGIFSNFDLKETAKNQATKMIRNKVMKELGLSALNPFLGIGSWLLGKFAPDKKAAFTEKLKSTVKPTFDKDSLLGTADWQGEKKRTKTFHEGEGGDKQQETTVQEAIAGKGLEEGQKMLGIDEIKKRHSLLQTTLNNGYYVDNKGRTIQLNDQQKAMLTNYISQIDDYLVNVDTRTMSAYGGRIDKALGGRVRDI